MNWQYKVIEVPTRALEAELTKLGLDHWELVEAHEITSANLFRCILKRAIQSSLSLVG